MFGMYELSNEVTLRIPHWEVIIIGISVGKKVSINKNHTLCTSLVLSEMYGSGREL